MTKQDFPEVDSEDVAWDAQLESWRDILRNKPFPLLSVANIAALPAANANQDGLCVVVADNGATGNGRILALSDGSAYIKFGRQAAAITTLVDNSGGAAADGTIGAVTTVGTAADAVKELATKLNALIVLLRAASIIDD